MRVESGDALEGTAGGCELMELFLRDGELTKAENSGLAPRVERFNERNDGGRREGSAYGGEIGFGEIIALGKLVGRSRRKRAKGGAGGIAGWRGLAGVGEIVPGRDESGREADGLGEVGAGEVDLVAAGAYDAAEVEEAAKARMQLESFVDGERGAIEITGLKLGLNGEHLLVEIGSGYKRSEQQEQNRARHLLLRW